MLFRSKSVRTRSEVADQLASVVDSIAGLEERIVALAGRVDL